MRSCDNCKNRYYSECLSGISYEGDKMDKKKWMEKQIGTEILSGLEDEAYEHYYRAMHDYGMDFQDADRYAWLNTLFGYDIGADRAAALIRWYYEQGLDVLELQAEDMETVKSVSEMELGLHFGFSGWPESTPEAMTYTWPDRLLVVRYNGRIYPVREAVVPGWGERMISVKSLEEVLIPEGKYPDEKARAVDEGIFYFVPDAEINREDLGEYVADEVN